MGVIQAVSAVRSSDPVSVCAAGRDAAHARPVELGSGRDPRRASGADVSLSAGQKVAVLGCTVGGAFSMRGVLEGMLSYSAGEGVASGSSSTLK